MAHTAEIIGDVAVKHAMIRGRVAGNINAQTVRLAETARVEGDIVADDSVEITPGAECAGRLKTMQASEKAKSSSSPSKGTRSGGS